MHCVPSFDVPYFDMAERVTAGRSPALQHVCSAELGQAQDKPGGMFGGHLFAHQPGRDQRAMLATTNV